MKPPFIVSIQLFVVQRHIALQNFFLRIIQRILFFPPSKNPCNILIFKVGNIGDTICAVPSLIAIRRAFPNSKITLLSSPGSSGMPGAKEFLTGVWYLDELKIYYHEDTDSISKKKKFIQDLKKRNCDLFIQLPDDLAGFKLLLRNMTFAKLIGVKHAFGFRVRTIQLFKKAQVDYASQKTEVESLLESLKENGIATQKVEYDFNVSVIQKKKIADLLKKKWRSLKKNDLIIVLNPGGKREANRWPVERFGKIGEYLQKKYKAKVIIVGGKEDIPRAETIKKSLKEKDLLILADKLELLEIIELLKKADFLISNDTGAVHMAAAVGLPVVGLYCIRNVFGRWLPYGENHEIIYHKFLNCDYRKEECIKKSIEAITVEEVEIACDRIISRLKFKNHV